MPRITAARMAVLTMIGPQMFGSTCLAMIRGPSMPETRAAAMKFSSRTDRAAPRVTRRIVGIERSPSATMPACGSLSVSE